MDSGRIRFFLSEVWRNFTRNLVMQLTAIGTVTVTILLLGSFLFTRQTLGAIGDDVSAWEEAGVTWRLAQIGPFELDFSAAREVVLAGPPRSER